MHNENEKEIKKNEDEKLIKQNCQDIGMRQKQHTHFNKNIAIMTSSR